MVCVHQGTQRLLALSPPSQRLRGFAFCSGEAAGERQAMGSGDEPPAAAIATSSLERRGQPCSIPKRLQPAGSFPWEGRILGSGSWSAEQGQLHRRGCSGCGSSLLAPKPLRWHQTRPRSTPRPWEWWVAGKHFFFFFLTAISGDTVIQEWSLCIKLDSSVSVCNASPAAGPINHGS